MTEINEQLLAGLADRYRIERQLGQGGMATVYLAQDIKHDRQVALKVLRPELGAVLGPDRFLAEIKIAARLDHPHILTLIDSGWRRASSITFCPSSGASRSATSSTGRATLAWRDYRGDAWLYKVVKP